MLAYLNGTYLPHSKVTIAPWDYGFMMGVTVTEFIRTFRGQLHLLDEHMSRLSEGISIVGIDNVSVDEIRKVATKLAEANFTKIDPESDLAVCISVTPGSAGYGAPDGFENDHQPTVLVYAKELAFSAFADHYEKGMTLCSVQTRELPSESIPKQLKNRSRVHYYLAEQEATRKMEGSRALLLNQHGYVAEGTTAGVCMVTDGVLAAPNSTTVLNSMTFGFLNQLAQENSIPVERRDISLDELKAAEEVIWFSTSMCCVPVTQIDDTKLQGPGTICRLLTRAWSEAVNVDVVKQAKQFG